MMNDEWDYTISGKTGNTFSLIFLFAVSAFFTVLSVDQLIGSKNKSFVLGLFLGVMALSSIVLFVKLAVMFFFVKVRVGKKGFYFQSNPFNGKYYEYTDVKNCYEELKTSRSGFPDSGTSTGYFYFFYFTDKDGKTHKMQFNKALYEHEFDVLKERINNSHQ